MKLKNHSLNIKVSHPILDTEEIFYMYYKELMNTTPWDTVRFLIIKQQAIAEHLLSEHQVAMVKGLHFVQVSTV